MHYLELSYADADPDLQQSLLAKLWHLVHAIARTHSLRYQVAFPDWRAPQKDSVGRVLQPGDFGGRMRLFSCQSALGRIAGELAQHRLVKGGLIVASPVSAVPTGVQSFLKVSRVQYVAKTTAGYQARAMRRAERRVAAGKRTTLPEQIGITRASLERAAAAAWNGVSLTSNSTGQVHSYHLKVECTHAESAFVSDNSFGLGGSAPVF